MRNKLADKTVHVSAMMPLDLHHRLVRQAAKETVDRGHRITPSQIIRWALEDYLNMWETATFVPDKKETPRSPASNEPAKAVQPDVRGNLSGRPAGKEVK